MDWLLISLDMLAEMFNGVGTPVTNRYQFVLHAPGVHPMTGLLTANDTSGGLIVGNAIISMRLVQKVQTPPLDQFPAPPRYHDQEYAKAAVPKSPMFVTRTWGRGVNVRSLMQDLGLTEEAARQLSESRTAVIRKCIADVQGIEVNKPDGTPYGIDDDWA